MNNQNKTPRCGRTGITYEDVATEASLIFSKGINPTNALVREKLGTGSFAKICEFMRIWWSSQKTNTDNSSCDISSKLLMAINSEIYSHVEAKTKVLDELRIAAEEDRNVLAREVGELSEQLNLLKTIKANLDTEIAEKNGVLSTLREHMNDAIQSKQEMGKEREKIVIELADARATTRHMESYAAEILELRARIDTTDHLFSVSEAMLAAATARCEQLKIANTRAESELDFLKQELAEVREAANKSTEQVLIELSDARRQSDKHILGLVGSRSSNIQQESKDGNDLAPQTIFNDVVVYQDNKLFTEAEGNKSSGKQKSTQNRIIDTAAEILHSGPLAAAVLRNELLQRGIKLPESGNIKKLSEVLSKASFLKYDRRGGGWTFVGELDGKGKRKSLDDTSVEFGAR